MVQPVEMYQTSSNTFHSQRHILAEWGEQCGGYINQLSKYSTSMSLSVRVQWHVCVCVCCRHRRVQRQAVPQQRVVCTRRRHFHLRMWTGLHWRTVWDRWAGLFFRQSRGKSRHLPPEGNIFCCFLHQTQSFGRCFCPKSFPVYQDKWFQVEVTVDLICKQPFSFLFLSHTVAMNRSEKGHWSQVGFHEDIHSSVFPRDWLLMKLEPGGEWNDQALHSSWILVSTRGRITPNTRHLVNETLCLWKGSSVLLIQLSALDGKILDFHVATEESQCETESAADKRFSSDDLNFVCPPDINECESQPCLNGGECVDRPANFTCVCPATFTGALCETGD